MHRPTPVTVRRLFNPACLFLSAILLSAQPAAAAGSGEDMATPEQLYQMALEARSARNYTAMLDYLRRSASGGDRAAREMLASVLIAGSSLYGKAVQADPCEAARWMRLSATQGSAVGRHQLLLLNGMRDLPGGRSSCDTGTGRR